jgi:hypothetical protein
LPVLEERNQFTCQVLRKNTLLSNSLCMPTNIEKEAATKKVGGMASKVVIRDEVFDLSKLAAVAKGSLK